MQNLFVFNGFHLFLSVVGVVILTVFIFLIVRFCKTKHNTKATEKKEGGPAFTLRNVINLADEIGLTIVGTRIHEGIVVHAKLPMTHAGRKNFDRASFYRLLVEEDGVSKYLFIEKMTGDYCILKKDSLVWFSDQDQFPIEEIPPDVIPIKLDDKDFDERHTAHYP